MHAPLAAAALAAAAVAPPEPAVFYSPHVRTVAGPTPPDLFPLLTAPETAWPELASRTSYFKLFMRMLYDSDKTGIGSTDAQLAALIATLKRRGIKTGIEIGGMRWGAGKCTLADALRYAKVEQKNVGRWLRLGGGIDSVTTDHAMTWNVRGNVGPLCDPPVPMAARVDIVAQVYADWRTFLPNASIGFIESLGYWEIDGPDGTVFPNSSPNLNNITGWIPRLDALTATLLAAAEKYNPTPGAPLLDHYQIDYEMEGVERDTSRHGAVPPVGINYGKVLGAEAVMRGYGLRSGIILGANYKLAGPGCLVGCAASLAGASHSAAARTLNFTRGYALLPGRSSDHAVVEQWQMYPNVTGPETAEDTGMWMASAAAAVIRPKAGGSAESQSHP